VAVKGAPTELAQHAQATTALVGTASAARRSAQALLRPVRFAAHQERTTVDAVHIPTELARNAQATQVLIGITVWGAVAPILESTRSVRLAARLDTITKAAWGSAMELARHARATSTAPGSTV